MARACGSGWPAAKSLRGDALIGADGLWSRIREAVVGDGKPRVSGHIAYRAVLKREEVPAHLWSDDVLLWGGEKTHLVHYPLRRGELFNLVAVFHSNKYDEGWNTFGDTAELNERFALAVPQVRELLGKIETWKMWVLCDREPVKNWSDRRVTLLGDAAHPMLQYLAQGAGQAIEDAVVLGAALRSTRGDVAALAFQKYQQARYLRTGRVQLTARFYGDIYHACRRAARAAQPAVPERQGVGRVRRAEVDVRRHRPGQPVPLSAMPAALTEPSRQTPVLGEYEVVVLGGGPAGIAAAVTAARAGRSTLLLERYGFLGGMGTAAGVTNFCGLHANVHGDIRQVVHGVADDLLARIDGAGRPERAAHPVRQDSGPGLRHGRLQDRRRRPDAVGGRAGAVPCAGGRRGHGRRPAACRPC